MTRKYFEKLLLIMVLLLVGCASTPLPIDTSQNAFASKDLTLIHSCVSSPNNEEIFLAKGVDSCHFTVGDLATGRWVVMAPPPKAEKNVTGGTVDLYYRDLHKSYPVVDWTVSIPFADFLGIKVWDAKFDEAIIEADLTVNWVDNVGLANVSKYRGIIILIVTQSGYEVMPIDSGNSAWGTECKVQYSTAGRSALSCK